MDRLEQDKEEQECCKFRETDYVRKTKGANIVLLVKIGGSTNDAFLRLHSKKAVFEHLSFKKGWSDVEA